MFQEITTKPKLFVDGMSAGDVTQGNLCYLYVRHIEYMHTFMSVYF